jgi:hypothetical protein
MPEGLQQSEQGQEIEEMAGRLFSIVQTLELGSIGDAIDEFSMIE